MSSTPDPKPPRLPQWLKAALYTLGVLLLVALGGLAYIRFALLSDLPSVQTLMTFEPKLPLRIYTADHVLIGEFGEERRQFVPIAEMPEVMKKAVLAIEDYRFYEHGAIDPIGIARAVATGIVSGHVRSGASTITQQVARNFFLSNEQTLSRKLREMVLAYRIERELTKDQILELYMNQINLGRRAYGFASAARIYFGKDVKDITLAEAAMLAGLPKAPSANNPVTNPKRARVRQEYILKRMQELGMITAAEQQAALDQPLRIHGDANDFGVHAEYIAEMVRQQLYAQYKEDVYTRGFEVTTTIRSSDQAAAYAALRKGVIDYDRRHGYRGPEATIALPADERERVQAIADAIDARPDDDELLAAVVTAADKSSVQAEIGNGESVTVEGEGLKFAANAFSPKAKPELRIQPGSVIRVSRDDKGRWQIAQLPQVEGALVSLSPEDGAIRALVGGFDFGENKFNHVTQAWRQPGSTFKPFIYSAALEKGLGPATLVNDAPLNFEPTTGGQQWDPKDDDQPDGPIPLRLGLQKSKNLVAIRVLNNIGTQYAQDYITKFGFDADKHPPYLPMALGAGQVTPLQLAGGYAVFANGGYRVTPYLVAEIRDARGQVLSKAEPQVAGQNAAQAIDPRNAYIMESLLRSVAQRGTGAGTNVLHRTDLAGKTGTTNEARDGWFAGYQHSLVAVAWLGYDKPRSLGSREFGAQLALPVWVSYMGKALDGVPNYDTPAPDGVTNIDGELYYADVTPGNGFVASVDVDQEPPAADASAPAAPAAEASAPEKILN
jgi:penicillin-binding protein 1A